MTVPKELVDKWRELKSIGDIEAIAEKSGFSYATIQAGISKGECTDEVFKAIAGFYKEKEEMVKQYL